MTAPRAVVRSLAELADLYDFTAPDLFVGPNNGDQLLDYGGPIVIANSRKDRPFHLRIEAERWSKEDEPDVGR